MTSEADQILNNFPEFYANTLKSSLWDAFKMIAPLFAPAILLVLVGTIAFTKKKMNPIVRTILIILTLLILVWVIIPILP